MTELSLVTTEVSHEDAPLLTRAQRGEVRALGAKLAEALEGCGHWYMKARGEAAGGSEHFAGQARRLAPDQLTWQHIAGLAALDENEGMAAWDAVVEDTREDLESGLRAYQAVAGQFDGPQDRARFLVLRRAFIRDWRPTGAVESSLIDQLAQAFTMQEYWTAQFNRRARETAAEDLRLQDEFARKAGERRGGKSGVWYEGEWVPERVTAADSIATAAGHADRWGKTFVRTLRTLRDLRRYAVVVQNAPGGQVNVGGQQVNVAQPPPMVPAGRARAKRARR